MVAAYCSNAWQGWWLVKGRWEPRACVQRVKLAGALLTAVGFFVCSFHGRYLQPGGHMQLAQKRALAAQE